MTRTYPRSVSLFPRHFPYLDIFADATRVIEILLTLEAILARARETERSLGSLIIPFGTSCWSLILANNQARACESTHAYPGKESNRDASTRERERVRSRDEARWMEKLFYTKSATTAYNVYPFSSDDPRCCHSCRSPFFPGCDHRLELFPGCRILYHVHTGCSLNFHSSRIVLLISRYVGCEIINSHIRIMKIKIT